jgi:predicted nuclease of predicted toxin-antitoxin system
MKFIVDAQIQKLSLDQNRIIITKDTDFFHSYILRKEPYKVIFVTVDNMRLAALKNLFEIKFDEIIAAISKHGMIEISKKGVVSVH